MRKFLLALASCAAVLIPTQTALAHHPVIVPSTDCVDADGNYLVTWIVTPDTVRGVTWAVNGNHSQPDSEAFIFTTSERRRTVRFTTDAVWSNGQHSSVQAQISRPAPCPDEESTSTSTTSTHAPTTTSMITTSLSPSSTPAPLTTVPESTSTSSPSTNSPDTTEPSLTTTPDSASPVATAQPAPTPTSGPPSPKIPATGVDNGLLAVLAAAFVITGGLLIRFVRKSS